VFEHFLPFVLFRHPVNVPLVLFAPLPIKIAQGVIPPTLRNTGLAIDFVWNSCEDVPHAFYLQHPLNAKKRNTLTEILASANDVCDICGPSLHGHCCAAAPSTNCVRGNLGGRNENWAN